VDVRIDEVVVTVRVADGTAGVLDERVRRAIEEEIQRVLGRLVPQEWPRLVTERLSDEIEGELLR